MQLVGCVAMAAFGFACGLLVCNGLELVPHLQVPRSQWREELQQFVVASSGAPSLFLVYRRAFR